MNVPMKKDDPAYWMLKDDFVSVPRIFEASCSLCQDSEFAQMGLPLCYKCYVCGGHVPADDSICINGHIQEPEEGGEHN